MVACQKEIIDKSPTKPPILRLQNKMNKLFLYLITLLFIYNAPAYAENHSSNKKSNEDILIQDGELVITRQDALYVLQDMSEPQRLKVLSDQNKLKNILLNLLTNKKQAQAARQNNLLKNKLIAWRLENNTNLFLSKELALNYSDNITVPDDISLLAKEYYDTHPEEFSSKESVRASHILFFTSNKTDQEKKEQLQKAKDLLIKLKNNELSFSEAAKKYSEDKGTARKGGNLGDFSRGKMVKPFENAVFSMKNIGDISDVVESQFGYHIIKLINRTAASIKPYEAVKDKLITNQINEYKQKKTGKYINSLGVTKNTNIFLPALEKIFNEQKSK